MSDERARIIGLIRRRIALAQHEAAAYPDAKTSHPYTLIAYNLGGLWSEIDSGLTAAELDTMSNEERATRVGYELRGRLKSESEAANAE